MITMNNMYWLTRLDHMHDVLGATCCLLVISTIGVLIAGCIMQDDDTFEDETNECGRKFVRKSPFMAAAFVVTLLIDALIPTTKEMAAMIVIPGVLNNEKVQTVGNRLYDLALEWMEELRPANKGGAK